MSNIALNNLIRLTTAGLSIANFVQIKSALITEYQNVYGSDIDIDDTTADGVYINNLSLMINNMLQTIGQIYDNLDVHSATGNQLDILCALSNIRRKLATFSNTTILLTYLGNTSETYTPDDLVFVDDAQVEWVPRQSYTFTTLNEQQSIYVQCRKSGTISAPAGWINKLVDASLPFTISQQNDANVGQEEESDHSLRARQTGSGSAEGITIQSSLESQLRSISGINDVKIINNFADTAATVEDGSVIPPHAIYPIVRIQDGVTIDDETIGKLIYTKLTPGIGCNADIDTSSGVEKSYENITTVNGISSSGLDAQIVKWKQASPVSTAITFHITTYPHFSTSDFETIADRLIDYLNALPLGTSPSYNDLLIQAVYADPKFKGVATYYVTAIDNVPVNPLTYFDFTDFEYTTDSEDSTKHELVLS